MKKALVLSGGGVKGAWQLGVLKRLMGEQKIDYDIMTGVSVGALNVAGLAQTKLGHPELAIDWLLDFWLKHVTSTSKIYTRWFPFGRLHSLWKPSLYDSRPLWDLFRSNFDQGLILSSGRQVAVGAVSLDTGEVRYARETDENFADFVLASSSFPVFLTPLKIEDQLWADGGIKEVTPLGQAISMGADEIDVLITDKDLFNFEPWGSKSKRAIPDQVVRAIELMSQRIMRRDIQVTGLKNDLADLGHAYKHVKVRVVVPSKGLTDNSLRFDPDEIKNMIDVGYEDADNFVIYD